MKQRTLAKIAGISYIIIFFTAIFANFYVLESILKDPEYTIQENNQLVRLGILAFLITVVFDIVVAWALYLLYEKHPLSGISTLFRMMHAAIMGVAVSVLPGVLTVTTKIDILEQIDNYNTIWLTALFFFGIHLILLGKILGRPKVISFFLILAGFMYMADTALHFMLPNYEDYGEIILLMVAIPSIIGEMALAIWLLIKGGRNSE